jgi:dihydrofolate synthase / folylpolyglutamate synthase
VSALETQLARLIELGRWGAKLGLERIEEALALLDDPQRDLRVVHIAGTNGKGSTAAMVEAVARRAGLRTGLYTSPHLCRFNERVALGGEPIGDDAFAAALERAMHPELPPLSLFETMTVAAFVAFQSAGVELAVLEVGMGGRLDATNAIDAPLCTAITSIGLDHQKALGADLASIAREKAGIAKHGAPLVVGPVAPEAAAAIEEVAQLAGADPIVWVEAGYRLRATGYGLQNLAGAHQRMNAAVAATICEQLRRHFAHIGAHVEAGIAEARWPGRLEKIATHGTPVLLDCAHNQEGVGTLCAYLRDELRVDPQRTSLVFGAIDEKPFAEMLDALAPLATRRHYCRPIDPTAGRRAVDPSALATQSSGRTHETPREALDAALSDGSDLIVVTGSIFLVGAARAQLLGLERHAPMPL